MVGAAASAQVHLGLVEHLVDEPVGASGVLGQCADVVPCSYCSFRSVASWARDAPAMRGPWLVPLRMPPVRLSNLEILRTGLPGWFGSSIKRGGRSSGLTKRQVVRGPTALRAVRGQDHRLRFRTWGHRGSGVINTAVPVQLPKRIEHLRRGDGIEGAGRLVNKQHVRGRGAPTRRELAGSSHPRAGCRRVVELVAVIRNATEQVPSLRCRALGKSPSPPSSRRARLNA